jgi:2-keto-3-deoxy-L-rhamnonate aldolase RhmA
MLAPLKEKIRAGRAVMGTWCIVASAVNAEIGARAGLDFEIFDLEHGAFDMESLGHAIRACEGAGSTPLVRVPDLNPSIFQSVLDLGAHGVIVPRITCAEDALRAVQYAKYPPLGGRGYNPFTRAADYAAPASNQQGKLHNDYTLIGVIIENSQAYADLPRILAISEIDVVYLGIYDMSLALGCQGNTQDQRVSEFVEDAAQQVQAGGKAVGMMVRNEAEMATALHLGARFLVYSVDSHILYRAFHDAVGEFAALDQGKIT